MMKLEINIPEGHEIDLERSNLSQGLVYFKKVEDNYPITFEDLKSISGYFVTSNSDITPVDIISTKECNKNVFPEERQAEAVLALSQLLQLRQRYLEIAGFKDWVADYTSVSIKYTIECQKNIVCNSNAAAIQRIISFPTSKLRNLFLTNFKDLLEIAKPLL